MLITGGAGGIGGQVVKLLAEKGIKVVVLDVIPMTFEAGVYASDDVKPGVDNSQHRMCITTSATSLRQQQSQK